jgi:hypothetical protein
MSDEPQQLLGPLSQSILRDFWKDRAGNWSMENPSFQGTPHREEKA